MTKLHFPFLIAVSLLAGACGKTGIATDEVRELSLSPEVTQLTKAEPVLSGNTLGTDNTYVVYLSASNAELGKLFSDQLYSYCNGKWRASSVPGTASPVFWPAGGQELDFLGIACTPQAHEDLTFIWDAEHPANSVKIEGLDINEHQYDILYASRNAQEYETNNGTVNMQFRHSAALLSFSAKCDAANAFTINAITVKGLEHVGDLTIDNTSSSLSASWKTKGTPADKAVSGLGDDGVTLPVTGFAPCGESLLILPQSAKSITLTYTLPHAVTPLEYTLHLPRKSWKAGYKYNYAFTLSLNQILVEPTVSSWDGTIVTEDDVKPF